MPRALHLLAAFALLVALAPAAPAQPTRRPPARAAVAAVRPAAATLRSGPMLGYVLHREVAVWAQTSGPARVQVRYAVDPASLPDSLRRVALVGPPVTTAVVEATAATGYTAHVVIAGLEPGRAYTYELLVDGRAVARPYPTRFRTQALWQWRTDPPAFTVALGSCAYVNDAPYDRPGTPYGAGAGIFASIARLGPAAMVWLGDNTYLREVDWWSEAGMDYRHAHTRAIPDLQPLLASTANYATWDDHDFGPNDADGSWVLKGIALRLFQRYWANVSYGLPDVPGVFGQFQVNDAEFFLVDDRYHRSSNSAPADSAKRMLGEQQLAWLIDALSTSRAPFKFVAVGGQVLNPFSVFETYATFPFERQRLLDELARRRISGVVFLTGDRHFTELTRLERPGMPPLLDFTSSPLTAGAGGPSPREADNPLRVPGTLVERTHTFGTLSFDGPRTDRRLTMRTHDAAGTLLWERMVTARELAFPDAGR